MALCLSLGIACYEVFGLGDGLFVFFEPLGIFVAIVLATVIGFALELNANKKFEMLNKVNDDVPVTVVRDGNVTQVARKDVVVGDIVMLGTGDEVHAGNGRQNFLRTGPCAHQRQDDRPGFQRAQYHHRRAP